MQKEERLRRRDPKAHTAMILERRERDIRLSQQYAPSHNPLSAAFVNPVASTQRLRWDAPMIATGDMLRPPSTASDATLGTGSMPNAPSIANHSIAISPNLDRPESGALSSFISKTEKEASVPTPKQAQIGTSKFTTHDLQNHIDDSVTLLATDQVAQSEEALGEVIGKLFGDGPLERSLDNKGLVPKALQKATREEFQAIISRKCLENRYGHVDESLRLSYARELRSFIVQKAKTEEEHRHLASGVKHLLDEESINPKILLKVLRDILRPSNPDPPTNNVVGRQILHEDTVSGQLEPMNGETETATAAAEAESGFRESGSGSVSSINGHRTEMNGMTNGSKENKGGRKRSAATDNEHPKKKVKPASPNLTPSNMMEKDFANLLRREAARSSRGRR